MTEVRVPVERPAGEDTPSTRERGAYERASTVIEPPRGWRSSLDFRGLWHHRELLYFLIWRDVKIRYRQTVLGGLWAILQPVMMMLVLGLFFGRLAGVGSDGVPYAVFVFAALVPWTFFAQSLKFTSDSVVASGPLISKVYFPRLIIPVAAATSFLLDFVLALLVLFGIMAWYGIHPTGRIVWLPLLALFTLLTSLAVGTWLSALNVRYRDVVHTVPFLIQLWLFASPVGYPASLVPGFWHTVYGLNPMAGVVEGFRWAIAGTDTRPGPIAGVSALVTLLLLVGGLVYFRRTERTFADVI